MKKLKKTINLTSIFVILLPLFLLGCCCDTDNLHDCKWTLQKYGPKDDLKEVLPSSDINGLAKSKILLELTSNNKFNGNDGCNSIFGDFEIGRKCSIEFSKINTTLILCPENVMNQAGNIRKILKGVKKYKIRGNELQLYTSDKLALIYLKEE